MGESQSRTCLCEIRRYSKATDKDICQFARVVKGVDLRSTAGHCAWVRTPQLTLFVELSASAWNFAGRVVAKWTLEKRIHRLHGRTLHFVPCGLSCQRMFLCRAQRRGSRGNRARNCIGSAGAPSCRERFHGRMRGCRLAAGVAARKLRKNSEDGARRDLVQFCVALVA